MIRNINRLNEELARWAFEIIISENDDWEIAFTNPTAGPWKTVKATSLKTGEKGEVYRFILEEDRPDIIVYNDKLKSVIIFEAKDSLVKLLERDQSKKSADVVIKLAEILSNKSTNAFWVGRESYKVIVGLLWGCTTPENESQIKKLFNHYHDLISGNLSVDQNVIIGIETVFKEQNLKCKTHSIIYNKTEFDVYKKIIDSLF